MQAPWLPTSHNKQVGFVEGIAPHAGPRFPPDRVGHRLGGLGTPVVSAAEDGAAVTLSLVAVFLPVLVIFLLLLLLWGLWVLWRRASGRRRRTDELMADAGY